MRLELLSELIEGFFINRCCMTRQIPVTPQLPWCKLALPFVSISEKSSNAAAWTLRCFSNGREIGITSKTTWTGRKLSRCINYFTCRCNKGRLVDYTGTIKLVSFCFRIRLGIPLRLSEGWRRLDFCSRVDPGPIYCSLLHSFDSFEGPFIWSRMCRCRSALYVSIAFIHSFFHWNVSFLGHNGVDEQSTMSDLMNSTVLSVGKIQSILKVFFTFGVLMFVLM